MLTRNTWTNTARKILIAAVLAASAVLAGCAAAQQAAPDGDKVPAYLQQYAECWARARSDEAAPLRCRHLAPGPDYYLRRDENGEAVYLTGGRFPVPRYDFTPEDHKACTQETEEWFKKSYRTVNAGTAYLFAEAVCAVPPPQYTNVQD